MSAPKRDSEAVRAAVLAKARHYGALSGKPLHARVAAALASYGRTGNPAAIADTVFAAERNYIIQQMTREKDK